MAEGEAGGSIGGLQSDGFVKMRVNRSRSLLLLFCLVTAMMALLVGTGSADSGVRHDQTGSAASSGRVLPSWAPAPAPVSVDRLSPCTDERARSLLATVADACRRGHVPTAVGILQRETQLMSERACEPTTNSILAFRWLGELLDEAGDPKGADASYARAIELQERKPIRRNVGLALLLLAIGQQVRLTGRPQVAEDYLRRAAVVARKEPHVPGVTRVQVLHALAEFLEFEDRGGEAAEVCRELLSVGSGSSSASENLLDTFRHDCRLILNRHASHPGR